MSKPTRRTKKREANNQDTPWGTAQSIEQIAPGITFYSTASHGGYHLSPEMNAKVPARFKQSTFCGNGLRGWYEEDCDWAIVVYFFKEHFEIARYQAAVETLKRFHVSAWDGIKKRK